MIIRLHNIQLYAFHGVLQQERVVGGWYEVEAAVETNDLAATETDNVADTINYAVVYDLIKREMQQPSNLIEHVAARIAKSILQQFPICETVTIKVTKKNPPIIAAACNATVELVMKQTKS